MLRIGRNFFSDLRFGVSHDEAIFAEDTKARARRFRTFMGILLLGVFLLPAGAKGADENKLIPANWAPSLSETENACKAELEKKDGPAPSQQEMNGISARLAEIYDARMFVAYVQLFGRLETAKREQLFREQEQWLRERETKAESAVQSKGGSLAALEYSGAFAELTQKRIAELQGRLREQAGESKQTKP